MSGDRALPASLLALLRLTLLCQIDPWSSSRPQAFSSAYGIDFALQSESMGCVMHLACSFVSCHRATFVVFPKWHCIVTRSCKLSAQCSPSTQIAKPNCLSRETELYYVLPFHEISNLAKRGVAQRGHRGSWEPDHPICIYRHNEGVGF